MEQTRNTTESIMKSEVLIIVFCIFAQSACAAPSMKSVKEDNTVKETDFKVCSIQSIFTFNSNLVTIYHMYNRSKFCA